MKTLLLLRHAKSSWANAYLADHDRPLNKRGKQDAPRMGSLLRREDLIPDLIITSSAKRARDTAKLLADSAGYEEEIIVLRQIYHGGTPDFFEILHDVPDETECALLVGHNPGLEEFLEDITGRYERMPTAALAEIHLPVGRWSQIDDDLQGKINNIWRPKELAF